MSFEFLSKFSIAYALESASTRNLEGFSYYLIHYNGEEQTIVDNEDVTLIFTGWADESKSTVNGKFEVHTDSSNKEEKFMIEVTNELIEFTVNEKERIYFRVSMSDSFNVEEVKPLELKDQSTVVVTNENGTSVEEVKTIDENGTMIENHGLTYFSTDDENQKIAISKEQYDSINPGLDSTVDFGNTKETNDDIIGNIAQFDQLNQLNTLSTQVTNEKPSINYSTHVQNIGWQNAVSDGVTSGTEGQNKRLESIKISIDNVQGLGVKYSTHVQGNGWLNYVSDGNASGTTGEGKRLEAIKIELTGEKAENYDIYYRVHAQDYGWMDWKRNGELSGTTGEAKRLEAIQIMVKEKELTPPPNEDPMTLEPTVTYKSHIQNSGWLDSVSDGELSGTVDQEKRLEAIQIFLDNTPYTGGISYKTHVQDYGWLAAVSDGATSGKTGEQKRVESIQMNLTGEMANRYDVYYRVYQQSFGWLTWSKNGETAGNVGQAKQLEAIEIVLIEKGGDAPGSSFKDPSVAYSTHVETYGWLEYVKNGAMAGTQGQAKRLEAMKIELQNTPYSGDIIYTTHVQDYGWLNNVSNGQVSGTSGQAKRLEAVKIDLTGNIANYYDVYYRVHVQGFGWLGWAKNGMKAGSEGHSKRLEAIEIKLVPKGMGEAVSEKNAFKQPNTVFIDPGHGGTDPGAIFGSYHEADLNLAVAKKVQSILSARGLIVYMSRYGNTTVELLNRSIMANNTGADIFVSIHTNSTASGETSASGIESYYYQDQGIAPKINGAMHNNPERISKSVTLTNLMQGKMIGYTGAVNRGTQGQSFSVVREAAMPASLIEMGFINNSSDRQKLFTDAYQNKLALAIADGITSYFEL
ncbi:N-acetylmuramoyl-L-alanine amidase [Bacillus sp. T3]|uniref:N-acetylmuramoyl-L-alanine amidase n=1 Tax=Bacillus sp. T3 TaxID=467262 RepID=UPI0029811B9E|nr:N-acetylmuramoyl-L-alanine amidase [Bacillus sp. T3]